MNLNTLLQICKDLEIPVFIKSETKQDKHYLQNYRLKDAERKGLKDYDIYVSWMTGGTGGGSCWNTGENDSHYSMDGEREPEFSDLDKILEKVCPTISFLQYKKIVANLVEYSDYGENEYYGNSTTYGVKKLNLVKLAGYLTDLEK